MIALLYFESTSLYIRRAASEMSLKEAMSLEELGRSCNSLSVTPVFWKRLVSTSSNFCDRGCINDRMRKSDLMLEHSQSTAR